MQCANHSGLVCLRIGEQLEQNQISIYFVAVIVAAVGGLLAPGQSQWLEMLVTPAIAVLMYPGHSEVRLGR